MSFLVLYQIKISLRKTLYFCKEPIFSDLSLVSMTYKRILLKLSGEALAGQKGYGFDPQVLNEYAKSIADAAKTGAQIAIVIGGGNIYRGANGVQSGKWRVKGDQMGMLATIINGLAIAEALESEKCPALVFAAFPTGPVALPYSVEGAQEALETGKVAILTAGTGNPFFTTDSAAALRATELHCDALLKGTRVDGIYDCDPEKNADAQRYDTLSFAQAYERKLRIMDLTAFTLCQENNIPIVVFNMNKIGALGRLIRGEAIGSVVTNF